MHSSRNLSERGLPQAFPARKQNLSARVLRNWIAGKLKEASGTIKQINQNKHFIIIAYLFLRLVVRIPVGEQFPFLLSLFSGFFSLGFFATIGVGILSTITGIWCLAGKMDWEGSFGGSFSISLSAEENCSSWLSRSQVFSHVLKCISSVVWEYSGFHVKWFRQLVLQSTMFCKSCVLLSICHMVLSQCQGCLWSVFLLFGRFGGIFPDYRSILSFFCPLQRIGLWFEFWWLLSRAIVATT